MHLRLLQDICPVTADAVSIPRHYQNKGHSRFGYLHNEDRMKRTMRSSLRKADPAIVHTVYSHLMSHYHLFYNLAHSHDSQAESGQFQSAVPRVILLPGRMAYSGSSPVRFRYPLPGLSNSPVYGYVPADRMLKRFRNRNHRGYVFHPLPVRRSAVSHSTLRYERVLQARRKHPSSV